MTEKTGQKMFIESLDKQHPERVLKVIQLEYMGFSVIFDLPAKRSLKVTINAYAKEDNTVEVYEHLIGSERHGRYWLIDSGHFIVDGTDPLPLLTGYLATALGGIEHGYEGSFAEVILAAFRPAHAEVSKDG